MADVPGVHWANLSNLAWGIWSSWRAGYLTAASVCSWSDRLSALGHALLRCQNIPAVIPPYRARRPLVPWAIQWNPIETRIHESSPQPALHPSSAAYSHAVPSLALPPGVRSVWSLASRASFTYLTSCFFSPSGSPFPTASLVSSTLAARVSLSGTCHAPEL